MRKEEYANKITCEKEVTKQFPTMNFQGRLRTQSKIKAVNK